MEQAPSQYVRYHRGFDRIHSHHTMKRLYTEMNGFMDSGNFGRTVSLYYGPTGCGKTYGRFRGATVESFWSKPPGVGFWFDGYVGQPNALIDEFSGARSGWRLDQFLQITDPYPVLSPVKGSHTPWFPGYLSFTTNNHPSTWYDYTERAENYRALGRRFQRVIVFARLPFGRINPGLLPGNVIPGVVVAGRPGFMELELTPEHPRWDRFWDGPPAPPVTPLMSDEMYRVIPPVNQYDYIFYE